MAKKGKDHLKKEHRLKPMYYFAAIASQYTQMYSELRV